MAKIISIADDVYKTLHNLKGRDSYSVAIRNLLERTSNKEALLSFFGKGGVDEHMLKDLRKDWKRWSQKYA